MKLQNKEIIKKIIDNKRSSVYFIVQEIIDDYILRKRSELTPELPFRLCYGNLPNDKKVLTVIDRSKTMTGADFYTLLPADKRAEKYRKKLKINFDIGSGGLYERLPIFKFEKILENIDLKDWVGLIYFIADDTDSKDKRLMDVMLSTIVPVPNNLQSINNHAIILTGTNTGKSVTYQRLGSPPVLTPSEAGMLGGMDPKTRKIVLGRLDGEGFFVFDEFHRYRSEHDRGTITLFNLEKALDYMRTGEVMREIVGEKGVKCVGSKCLIFMSNYKYRGYYGIRDFLMLLGKLGDLRYTNKYGARIGHVMYNDYDVIKFEVESDETKFLTSFIQELLWWHKDRVYYYISKYKHWLNNVDDDYRNDIIMLLSKVPTEYDYNDAFTGFWRGHLDNIKAIKMGALKYSILMNLPIIVNRDDVDLMPMMNFMYNRFKQINLDSLKFIVSNDKFLEAWLLRNKEKKTLEEISSITGISIPRLSSWFRETLDTKLSSDFGREIRGG